MRHTIEEVRESFESEGYTLVSTEYINNSTKLDYICPNGHEHSIAWNHWHKGIRCAYCAGRFKHTIENIKKLFEFEGYTLLSTTYKNSGTKLDYICPKGHKSNIIFDNWLKGNRCWHCFGSKKFTIEQVKQSFESEGYILLSTEYKNKKTKLDYICPKGHKHNISWSVWKRGSRCFYCKPCKTLDIIKDNVPLFKTYAHQIDFAESVREFVDNKNRILLEVKCKYCQEWFVPGLQSVQDRIKSLNGKSQGEQNLYCSQKCKDKCPIFKADPNHYLIIKEKIDLPYTQYELDIWAETVKLKYNYICEICGDIATDAHHIKPKKLFPNEALDIDNGIALCRYCHIKHGHSGECSTGHLASIVCTYSNSSANSSTDTTEPSIKFSSTNSSTISTDTTELSTEPTKPDENSNKKNSRKEIEKNVSH